MGIGLFLTLFLAQINYIMMNSQSFYINGFEIKISVMGMIIMFIGAFLMIRKFKNIKLEKLTIHNE